METGDQDLRNHLIEMATMTETMLNLATAPESSFEEIITIENKINHFHSAIDDECFKNIALKKPMARELRFVIAAMKINAELERIADCALNIKRAFMQLKVPSELLSQIILESLTMTKNAIDCFVQSDVRLAADVIQRDQYVNDQNKSIIQTYTRPGVAPDHFDQAYLLILISNKLERISDHATNIAEDVIFFESGKDVRHLKDKK